MRIDVLPFVQPSFYRDHAARRFLAYCILDSSDFSTSRDRALSEIWGAAIQTDELQSAASLRTTKQAKQHTGNILHTQRNLNHNQNPLQRSCNPSSVIASANAAAHAVPILHLASPLPPSYEATSTSEIKALTASASFSTGRAHPRVAIQLGINSHWHIPLLVCRALSTAPAAWWGLRCALTFLGDLLLGSDGMGMRESEAWTVEKRFRVTEVFLAILWVRPVFT